MATRSIRKVLIANRGEIAVRVIRTCREMGIGTVAVFSDADRAALHVRMADEAYPIGPAPSRESYLRTDKILDVYRRSGADAIHPGYGFLSENAAFVRACNEAGALFIGPPAEAMDAMGEKTAARRRMTEAGVPVVPGAKSPIADANEALSLARDVGFPVMIKAAAGGGGKGMHRVDKEEHFIAAFATAQREATSAFGDGRVYVEKFLSKPRHIEIQIFADEHGNCIHLNERECSVQRRNQKVIEETPSAIVDEAMRERMGQMAVKAALAVNYVGAGTIECLVDADRNFYFLEMNTRLQVEHPITELITGLDLVRMQILVAQGHPLPLKQEQVERRGHAVEARVYAEDPAQNFMPAPGRIESFRQPGGPGLRNDAGVYEGFTVPLFYDPMISKLAAWHETREGAIDRLKRALGEYKVGGITTNIAYLKRILDLADFRAGDYDTSLLSRHHDALTAPAPDGLGDIALMAAAIQQHRRDEARAGSATPTQSTKEPESQWKILGRAGALRRGEV
jgi:acetyl-CoA carboxylase biotin carboxylase subunit